MKTKNLVQDLRALSCQVKSWLDARHKAGEIVCGRDRDRLTFLLTTKDAFERVYVALLLDHGHAAEAFKQLYDAIVASLSQSEIDDPQGWADTVLSSCRDLMLRCHGLAKEMEAEPPRGGKAVLTESRCEHTEDFASVTWYGSDFQFNPTQARCVGVLWRAWQRLADRAPAVHQRTIRDEIESQNADFRLAHVFRSAGVMHPAWGTMIHSAGGGRFYLDKPVNTESLKGRSKRKTIRRK
ncbi:MAG: hypothetical protein GXY19_10430 [Phycisphaerae bacterium]|nr:hypothetical protein [Phycisphaerae bacterium]